MGMQPILPVTVSIKKIKGSSRQRNVVTVGVHEPLHWKAMYGQYHCPIVVSDQAVYLNARHSVESFHKIRSN